MITGTKLDQPKLQVDFTSFSYPLYLHPVTLAREKHNSESRHVFFLNIFY